MLCCLGEWNYVTNQLIVLAVVYVNTDCDNFTVLLQAHAKVIDGVVTVIANPTDAKLKQTVVTREIVNGELVQVVYYITAVAFCSVVL